MPKKPIDALSGRLIRGILFDLGDTLWTRREDYTWEQLETTANSRAVVLLREHIAPQLLPDLDDVALGNHLRQTFNKLAREFIRSHPGIEANGPLVAVQTLEQWGIKQLDKDFGTAIFEALRVRIPESRRLFPDTLSMLAELQKRGFLLGIVSNRLWGGEPFQEDMQAMGLFNYFEPGHMAISADLGVRKPNPTIFLHALNALNVPPEEAVMVGDSLRADIVGGLGLGIFSVWKPKARVRDQLPAHLLAHGPSTIMQDAYQVSPSSKSPRLSTLDPSVDDPALAAPPPGMHASDDDILLATAQSNDYLSQFIRGEIRPDLIIEHLSELLDIFLEVGVQ